MRKRQKNKNLFKKNEVTFELKGINGAVLDSDTIVISRGGTLALEFDNKTLNLEQTHKIYKSIVKSFQSGSKVIAYPKGVSIRVISKV